MDVKMTVEERYESVVNGINNAAEEAGRDPNEVHLLVVSKTWPAEKVRPLIAKGHRIYGENRVQEALEKIPLLPDGLKWHLIGHLQKNKIRKALPFFDVIQTVDSIELARQIDRVAGEMNRFVEVLLQVNVAEEPQKTGFSMVEIREMMGDLLTLPRLEISGLMAIPPVVEDPESSREPFRVLAALRDELQEAFSHPLPELSMGMSHDYGVAIEEGATIVRVGSAIFGPRG